MKLKLIAAAAVMVVAGSANAALIDNGANSANGNLFLSVWDSANSYTVNLNETMSSFEAWAASSAPAPLTFLASNIATFVNAETTAGLASQLKWNIVAVDNQDGSLISTYSTLPTAAVPGPTGISAASAAAGFVGKLNLNGTFATGNSSTFIAASPAYAGGAKIFSSNFAGAVGYSFSNAGTLNNNSYATGLGILRWDGSSLSTDTTVQSFYASGPKAFYDASTGAITIAAVPEPETFAMLLAGLGLMGVVARRRQIKVS